MTREKLKEIEQELLKEYEAEDCCLYDFLAGSYPRGDLSFEDCVQIYVDLMHEVEGDEFHRIVEDELEDMYTGERAQYICKKGEDE